jgi:O-antigen biosynthesis protein
LQEPLERCFSTALTSNAQKSRSSTSTILAKTLTHAKIASLSHQLWLPMIDIIIPVYNGFDVTQACLESALSAPYNIDHRFIIINDASTDEALNDFLRKQDDPRITLLENEQNSGFTLTVNRGLNYSKENDVVLLNSDTEVANDWLDRLHKAAYSDKKIATVTPFTNNATICSFPMLCEENELYPNTNLTELDNYFATINRHKTIEIPSGVGFCLYIKRECLNQIGVLDKVNFPRGYGEENDLCLRAVKHGWTNVLAGDVFVFHKGSVSFGKEKQKLLERAMRVLAELYPNYHPSVGTHIRQNPAKYLRLAIEMALIANSTKPSILFVTHNHGGGTEKHVKELAQLLSCDANILIMRSTYSKDKVSIAFNPHEKADKLLLKIPKQIGSLHELLKLYGVSHIHFHHLAGHCNSIVNLPSELNLTYDLSLHDYCLLLGKPKLTSDEELNSTKAIKTQKHNQSFIENAGRIFSPSQATKHIFNKCFPHKNILWAPHPDKTTQTSAHPAPSKNTFNILVLGGLCKEKGADLLAKVAGAMHSTHPQIKFILIGHAYRELNANINVHGCYQDHELDQLMTDYQGDLIWFPALWAETYCYTLTSALCTTLPILAPNVGAFPERLSGREWSWITDYKQSPQQHINVIEACHKAISNKQAPTISDTLDKDDTAWTYDDYHNTLPANKTVASNVEDFISKAILISNENEPKKMLLNRLILNIYSYLYDKPLVRKSWHKLPLRLKEILKNSLIRE